MICQNFCYCIQSCLKKFRNRIGTYHWNIWSCLGRNTVLWQNIFCVVWNCVHNIWSAVIILEIVTLQRSVVSKRQVLKLRDSQHEHPFFQQRCLRQETYHLSSLTYKNCCVRNGTVARFSNGVMERAGECQKKLKIKHHTIVPGRKLQIKLKVALMREIKAFCPLV